jgi:hypothetical protein
VRQVAEIKEINLRSVRLTRSRTPIAYYQRGLAVHVNSVVPRVRMKTQLAQRNGTRTRKGKGVKKNNHSIDFYFKYIDSSYWRPVIKSYIKINSNIDTT